MFNRLLRLVKRRTERDTRDVVRRGQRRANEGRNSEYTREKMWARIYLMPLLQAEEDRDQVRRYYADQARAKELLGDQDIQVYYSDRYEIMHSQAWVVIANVAAGLSSQHMV